MRFMVTPGSIFSDSDSTYHKLGDCAAGYNSIEIHYIVFPLLL